MFRLFLKSLVLLFLTAHSAGLLADKIISGKTTSWGHPTTETSYIRGLAYDGHYYYVADCNDSLINNRPNDNTGRIYIYDNDGKLYKKIPEIPPVTGTYFPTGVATDGVKLWATDYWGSHIYEYNIATGEQKRKFKSPVKNPVRLDYQASTKTLWLTAYGDPKIYKIGLNGKILSSFTTSGFGVYINPALDGRGGLWLSTPEAIPSGPVLMRSTLDGTILKTYTSLEPGYWGLATNIFKRGSGVKDLKPVFNPVTNHWESKFQHFRLQTVGGWNAGLSSQTVTCENLTTLQSITAHAGGAEAWNCEDGGLTVNPGDQIRIEVTGAGK